MHKARTDSAGAAARVRPLVRLADWSCMSVTARGLNFPLDAGLIRKSGM
jgi:hypothetical protein